MASLLPRVFHTELDKKNGRQRAKALALTAKKEVWVGAVGNGYSPSSGVPLCLPDKTFTT